MLFLIIIIELTNILNYYYKHSYFCYTIFCSLIYILWWQVFSREYSHKDFCLAHLFTDLKFEGGILGLAYVGSPRRNSVGGICTPGDRCCK